MQRTTCPLCGGSSTHRFTVHGHSVRDCGSCAHRFADVVPGDAHIENVYGDDYFSGGGAGYDDYVASAALLSDHGRRYGEVAARHLAPGRMLDVGAAAGFLIEGWIAAGWQAEGIEPNVRMAQEARTRLGIDVRCTTAEEFAPDKMYDLVSMVQVIAHFTDPVRALSNLELATRPGGLWLIETWDRSSLTARIAGHHWHEYSPPSVLHWYSRESLGSLLRDRGFELIEQGRPGKRILGSHAKSLLRYKLGDSRWLPTVDRALALVPDRTRIPYPADDLFWLLARKAG